MQTKTLLPVGTKLIAVKSFEDIKIGDIGTIHEIIESNIYSVMFLDKSGNRKNKWYLGQELTFTIGATNHGVCMKVYQKPVTEITIQAPEGMVIDEENSTFSKIKFKPKEKQYPKSLIDLDGIINAYFVDTYGEIFVVINNPVHTNKNLVMYCTEKQAKAAKALAALTLFVKAYNENWEPDYENDERNFIIDIDGEKNFYITSYTNNPYLLTFKTEEVANVFLKNFEDLIKEASPLLFGYTFKD